jgi:hypothetical protein
MSSFSDLPPSPLTNWKLVAEPEEICASMPDVGIGNKDHRPVIGGHRVVKVGTKLNEQAIRSERLVRERTKIPEVQVPIPPFGRTWIPNSGINEAGVTGENLERYELHSLSPLSRPDGLCSVHPRGVGGRAGRCKLLEAKLCESNLC